MLTERIIDQSSVWLIFGGTVLLLLVAREIGFRLGIRRRAVISEDEKTPANATMGSTLGLLAFMLAFTFGMSSTRFDARRQLVLDEASAVMRAYHRAQFLPEPQRTECSRLLREYLSLRNETPSHQTLQEIEQAVQRSEKIQDSLWREAAKLSQTPNSNLTTFLRSAAELSELHMKRIRAAVWNRIPPMIILTLYAIAFLGLATMGFGAGLSGSRTMLPAFVLILAFSAIMVLIIDLERPRQELFHISHEPMVDAARRIDGLQD